MDLNQEKRKAGLLGISKLMKEKRFMPRAAVIMILAASDLNYMLRQVIVV